MTVMEFGQQKRDLSINHPARYARMLTEWIGEAL